jgi:hypothetical protein
MMKKKFFRRSTNAVSKSIMGGASQLPKGFEAASPIKNKKLMELLSGPDITTSGGTHTVVDGQPLLGSQPVHR